MHQRLAQLREERENGEHGFTLIELLVVVVIIGILIAIAIPLYLNYQKSSHDKQAQSDLRNAISVLETCNSDNGSYPTAVGDTGGSLSAGGCSAQTVNVSSGSHLNYTQSGTGYILTGTNDNGSGKVYCYNSNNGGSVQSVASTDYTTATC